MIDTVADLNVVLSLSERFRFELSVVLPLPLYPPFVDAVTMLPPPLKIGATLVAAEA
jgi:hypothetical protein